MDYSKESHFKPIAAHHWTTQLILVIVILLPSIALAENGPASTSTFRNDKTWTFNAGLGSSKAWNLVGITKDFFVSDHTSGFFTAGLGEMILGAGFAYYDNRKGDGIVVSAVAGTGVQFSLTYRRKLAVEDFLTLGGTYIRVFGFSDVNHPGLLPVCSYEHRF